MLSLRRLLIAVAIFYGLAALVLFIFQRSFMYFPSNVGPAPSDTGLQGVEAHQISTTDGETIEIWHTPAQDGKPTILFFHGNAGEIGSRAARLAFYQAEGFGALFVSWRGYGNSSGSPTEAGLHLDALAAYDWLEKRGVPLGDIVIIGESLGTGVAVQLAATKPAAAVVLGAPYSATSDVAAGRFPWLPVQLLMKDQYRSIDHISRVSAPILIVHGTDDDVILYELGQRLSNAAPEGTIFQSLEGVGHQMLFQPLMWEREVSFIKSLRLW